MAENNSKEDLSNPELNRNRGGLGIALALAGSLGLFLFLSFFSMPALEKKFACGPLPAPIVAAFDFSRAARSPIGAVSISAVLIAGLILHALNRKNVVGSDRLLLALLVIQVLATALLFLTVLYCHFEILPAIGNHAG